ncbi:Protein kinase domain-containing protein [Psidium guajava]|nr:Protein kinase domain-containing protein [Psidium guajava]
MWDALAVRNQWKNGTICEGGRPPATGAPRLELGEGWRPSPDLGEGRDPRPDLGESQQASGRGPATPGDYFPTIAGPIRRWWSGGWLCCFFFVG